MRWYTCMSQYITISYNMIYHMGLKCKHNYKNLICITAWCKCILTNGTNIANLLKNMHKKHAHILTNANVCRYVCWLCVSMCVSFLCVCACMCGIKNPSIRWSLNTNMLCQCGYPDGMSPRGRMVLPRALPSGKPFSLWETFHQDTHTGMAYLFYYTEQTPIR